MKQIVTALGIGAALATLIFVAYSWLFSTPMPLEVTVHSTSGEASVEREGGSAHAVAKGEVLRSGDRLKTEEGGEVVLAVHPEDRVVVTGNTQISVAELSPERAVFELTYGKVTASLTPHRGRAVEFEAPGNPISVVSADGEFTMTHDGWGTVDIQPISGEVITRQGEVEQELSNGKRSIFGPNGDVLTPGAADRAVLLKVDWPAAVPAGDAAQIKGQAEPGNLVTVDGQRARVGPDGSFALKLPIPESGRVVVTARSSVGERTLESDNLAREQTPPPEPTPPKPPARGSGLLKVKQTGDWR